MTKIKDIIEYLESIAPLSYQESYDNSGLLTGNPDSEIESALVTLDCTEEVVNEAIDSGTKLIISHHPIIFHGLKSLTGKNYVERTVISAVKNDVAIYAIHTNLDNVLPGVNKMIAEKIGLKNLRILKPSNNNLCKLVTFIPEKETTNVLDALHNAGAGIIGNYEKCSFRVTGTGTFKPNELANPTIGEKGSPEEVREDRIEMIFPSSLKKNIVKTLKQAHPYEEAAYYVNELTNENQDVGAGMIGSLNKEMSQKEFLAHLKSSMKLEIVKYTEFNKPIKQVAICGGAGSFLLSESMQQQADSFVSSDFKYHEFFDAENKIMIADIGHYESEVYTKDLLTDYLRKKFPNFAVNLSGVTTNPINYFN